MEKLVIIPTYNEKDNIQRIIEAVMGLQENFHVLIVDDGSPDGTGAIVQSLQHTYPGQLFLEERSGKQGLGTAYIHGFKWALAKGYEYIFEMDADFSHNPNDLPRLFKACAEDGADVSVGSRYVKGGNTQNWPWDRAVLSYGASVYVGLVTWIPVRDATAGFVCYHRRVLEAINLDAIQFVGYAFQIEMKFTAWKLGFTIKEVPITFVDRKEGYSKMSKGIVKEGILGVLKIQFQSLFKKYHRRVAAQPLQPGRPVSK
ncbi:dolichol-phosphate mannosyltransferase [Chitinophaga costaii]|uniref:Dolichol-phosphate mannosyltransferase n=1 Tax=Chitinophaga costaii TaxID=1335309 RepID=A0A1C4FUS1_9BACT|nr:polyprenol monophosphomannose synthase [Chitinophaga costaii]PUZ27232.1 polyprenol monophosphomannose synthase [Chitinophaga costaii]SCC59680.1 dolichol-phosphate mannosyltransferase [Chitinophaga costaii]